MSDNGYIYNKDKYSKFYEIFNNVILFFIINTYETQFKKIKASDNFNLDEVNILFSRREKALDTLKLQLNLYWNEYITNFDAQNTDPLLIDINDLYKIGIIKHKLCLFKLIKNECIYIINNVLDRIKLENINDYDYLIERIAQITKAVLEIQKITEMEDEDDFDCIDCIDTKEHEIFWN